MGHTSMEFFPTERRQVAEMGEKRLCAKAVCCECGVSQYIAVAVNHSPEGDGHLFRAKGWDVNRRRRNDRCPSCKGATVRVNLGEHAELILKEQAPLLAQPAGHHGEDEVVSTAALTHLLKSTGAVSSILSDAAIAKSLQPAMQRLKWDGAMGIKFRGASVNGYRRRRVEPEPVALKHDVAHPAAAASIVIEKEPPMPTVEVQTDRRPTRSQIRAIQDELDAKYDVAKECYKGDASDAMIATKLDLPRVWVAEERERAYGPEGNEAADELRRAIGRVEDQIKGLEPDITKLMDRQGELFKQLERLQVAAAKLGAR